MLALISIIILVSGYNLIHSHPYFFYRLHRFDGQLLYLQCAAIGTIVIVISTIFFYIIFRLLPKITIDMSLDLFFFKIQVNQPFIFLSALESHFLEIFHTESQSSIQESTEKNNAKSLFFLVSISIISVFVRSLWVLFYSIVIGFKIKSSDDTKSNDTKKEYKSDYAKDKKTIFLLSSLLIDSPLDSLFLDAILEQKPIMLSMDDRKIYIGYILTLGKPNETKGFSEEIKINPIMSGYRDKDTLKVTKTTSYKGNSIVLVLKHANIISATIFDEKQFEYFMAEQKKEEKDASGNLLNRVAKKLSNMNN